MKLYCPVRHHRSGFPVLQHRSGSPVLDCRSGSPVLHYEPDSPLVCYRSGSPVLHYESDFSPDDRVRQESLLRFWCWLWSQEAKSRLAAVLDHWRDDYRDVAIFAARVTGLSANTLYAALMRLENAGWVTCDDGDLRPANATAAFRQCLAEVSARTRTIYPAVEGHKLHGAERHGPQFHRPHSARRRYPWFRPGLGMPVPGGLYHPGRSRSDADACHRVRLARRRDGEIQTRALSAAGTGCRGTPDRPRACPQPGRPRHQEQSPRAYAAMTS